MRLNCNIVFIFIILIFTISIGWSQQIYFNFLAPSQANPVLPKEEAMHYYVRPVGKPSGSARLLLVLPGTKGKPRNFMRFCDLAGTEGYHVIALNYENGYNIRKLCQQSAGDDCFWNIRQEIVIGIDAFSDIEVSGESSVAGRLRDVLLYLVAQDAEGSWQQFIDQREVQWSLVTVAGHSQGAGHAALLGKLYALQRVILIAGPNDYHVDADMPAPWLSKASATPVHRWYAWLHTYDSSIPVKEQIQQLDALRVPSSEARFPAASVIPQGTHRVMANMDSGSPYTHLSLVIDAYTPVDDQQQPIYAPVWRYFLQY
jgi:pimeloyl-ACP methyl ester carboxylesterase